MLTVFEVQVDATQTNYSQLVVYVSEGTVIRNVDIQNLQCSAGGMLLCSLINTWVCLQDLPIIKKHAYTLNNLRK